MAGDTSLSEHYAFCGMQHIFDQHRDPVTVIKFANNDKTRLACASRDGTLSVFSLEMDPPSLSCCLRGHSREVNGNSLLPSHTVTCTFLQILTGQWVTTQSFQHHQMVHVVCGTHSLVCVFVRYQTAVVEHSY